MSTVAVANRFVTPRARHFPFLADDTDSDTPSSLQEAIEALQEESVANGNDKLTLDEINAIIAECRAEARREAQQ